MNISTRGIDISYANRNLDFQRIRASGITFAVIRTGYRQKTDDMFESHIKGALKAGLNVGVYCYCLAASPAEARREAEHVLSLIKPYKLTYPVFYDIEDKRVLSLSRVKLTNIAMAFLERIERENYRAGLYANPSILENNLSADKILDRYDLWLAHWTNDPAVPSRYVYGQKMWQWGADHIYGAEDKVDCDICYVDYPAIIAANGQNRPDEDLPELSIGDMVLFSGGMHYAASEADKPVGRIRTAGTAQITNIAPGTAHPFHLIGDSSNVYGWVNENTIFRRGTGAAAKAASALNLRESPESGNVLTVIPNRDAFIVFNEYRVAKDGTQLRKAAYNGYVGFVNAEYIL
ncbi:MAG: hypothetical protein NC394_01690 [Bacteroides sp.]|nr:hypothetical protein [Bacteroides sp.]